MLLAGLLAHPSSGLPTPKNRDSGVYFRRNIQVYSSGDCSGFAPDSLIKALPGNRKKATTTHAKVENYFGNAENGRACPQKKTLPSGEHTMIFLLKLIRHTDFDKTWGSGYKMDFFNRIGFILKPGFSGKLGFVPGGIEQVLDI